jgi:hypothetical protein
MNAVQQPSMQGASDAAYAFPIIGRLGEHSLDAVVANERELHPISERTWFWNNLD